MTVALTSGYVSTEPLLLAPGGALEAVSDHLYPRAESKSSLDNTVRWSRDQAASKSDRRRRAVGGALGVTAKEKTDDRGENVRAEGRMKIRSRKVTDLGYSVSSAMDLCLQVSKSRLHARRLGMWDALCGERRRDNINAAPPTTMAVHAFVLQ